MPVQFDVDGARKNGYSDAQIADAIAQKAGFDATGARKAGFDDASIIQRLTSAPAPRKPVDMDADVAAALATEAQGKSTKDAIIAGAGHTFDMIGKGIHQAYNAVVGDDKDKAELQANVDRNNRLYAPTQDAHPIATAVGSALPAMAVPIGGVPATLAGTAGKMAVASAVPMALEYGSIEDRAKKAALGAAGGVIGGVAVPKVIGGIVAGGTAALKGLAGAVTPEAIALAQKAEALGIPINAAQLGDSKFIKTLASSLEQMPFTGMGKWVGKQKEAFNKAVGETFGAQDAAKITPEVYATQKKRLGDLFDQLSARNNLDVTGGLKSKLSGIVDQAESTGADDTIRAVKNIFGRVTDQSTTTGGAVPAKVSSVLGPNGQPIVTAAASNSPAVTKLAGTAYSSIDSELSNIIKAGGEKGMYAKQMQTAIREAMDQSISPADQALWGLTREQYKNLKAVRNIVAKDGANGDIPPTQLMHALNGTEAGKEVMAMGSRGTLGDLSKIGKTFVRDSIPNSGTAQRAMAMGLIGGGGYAFGADPSTIAGMMAGGATAGKLMTKVLASPKTVQALSRQGISLKDLAKMPPSRIAQVVGGATGQVVVDPNEKDGK